MKDKDFKYYSQEFFKNFSKNMKAIFNKVKMSNFLSLLVIILMIVVFSLWSVGWNPEQIGWHKFLVNLAFLIFLGIYGLFFGETTGIDFYKTIVTGAYYEAKSELITIIDKIIDKGYAFALPEYIVWRYRKDYEAECQTQLLSVGLLNPRIIYLTEEEIEELSQRPICKTWGSGLSFENEVDYFSKLNDEQYVVLKEIKNGNIRIEYIEDYNFFLMDTLKNDNQLVRNVKNVEKKKLQILWQQRASRILLIIMFSTIGAGIAIDKSSGIQLDQTLINLSQRLTVLITSILCGFNTARILNKQDVEVLKYKTSYDKIFCSSIESGAFVPTDYNKKAQIEFEKSVVEEQEQEQEQEEEIEITQDEINLIMENRKNA